MRLYHLSIVRLLSVQPCKQMIALVVIARVSYNGFLVCNLRFLSLPPSLECVRGVPGESVMGKVKGAFGLGCTSVL